MHDAGKIIGGLIIFLALITSPVWYNIAGGKADYRPEPKIVTTETECVMPKDYMRAKHMDLLNEWRNLVVREGQRVHLSHTERKFKISLTGTCMSCHSNKTDFCDECHNYSAVGQPVCWNCHIIPEEVR